MIVGVLLLVCGIATAMPFEDVSSSANSPHVANLKRVSGTRNFNHIRRQSELNAGLTDDGLSFLMEVTVGHQVFNVTVDTGSSDTWLAGKDVECTPGWECDFGTLYDIANDRSFQLMPDLNIHLTYEDDTSVEGVVGTNSMTLAGFTVPSQEIGVIKQAAFNGDGMSSGILGLAFPALTSVFPGTNYSADNRSDRAIYSPIIKTMFDSANFDVYREFTFAVSRDESNTGNGGLFVIGTLPELIDPVVNVTSEAVWATAPFETVESLSPDDFSFYAITVDSLLYGSGSEKETSRTAYQYIVDTGSTQLYLPHEDAVAINALFDPPGSNQSEFNSWIVDCSATAPDLTFFIGGHPFLINPRDLIVWSEDGCFSGVASSLVEEGPYSLRDPFLKNVLAVFDANDSEMV